MKKQIDVNFHWIDDECAEIECPNCHVDITISIYEDSGYNKCVCGKQFLLQQRNWVEEII